MRISFFLGSLVTLIAVSGVAVGLSVAFPGNGLTVFLSLCAVSLAAAVLLRKRLLHATNTLEVLAQSIPDTLEPSHVEVPSEFDSLIRHMERAAVRTRNRFEDAEQGRRELEVLLEGMQEAVVAVDAGGRIQWSNARMQRLMERDGGAATIHSGRALVHTIRDPAVLECVQIALEERVVAERRSTLVLSGSIFDVIASPLPGGGAVAVLHDITKAEEVERTQRDFVGNVSHELRTPLTSIVGYVETLLDHENLSPAAREFLETILKNAARMNRLTQDLLVLTRVASSEQWLHRDMVSADDLLREAVRSVSGTLQREGVKVQVTATTDLQVFADEHAILQVLENLIENAIKYGRAIGGGAAQVFVSAEKKDFEGETGPQVAMIEFCVQDHGQGIGMEHADRIFERFYRVDKARSRETGGTGLGLAIVRHIVEEHGGRVWLESNLGQGSAFHFTLPVANAAS